MSEHRPDPKPQRYDELYDATYLNAEDLDGRQVTLIIKAVDRAEFVDDDGDVKRKGVLTFEKTTKKLALISTNGQCIKGMFGDRVQEWVGKRITLWPDPNVKYMTKAIKGIRVWGSHDIPEDMDVKVKLPRKKAFTMAMHAMRDREPGQEG